MTSPASTKCVQEPGQRAMRGTDLGAEALVGPGRGGPAAVEVAGPDHDGIGVAAIGEPAAEAGMHAGMNEDAARPENSRRFP